MSNFLTKLGQLNHLGRGFVTAGGDSIAALTAMFNPSLLTLSDAYGNVAEAISITGRTMTQYNGVLVPLGATEHHLQRGRRVENLLSYTEDFSNAYWSKVSGATITPNVTAPDGSTTAETFTSGGVGSAIRRNFTVAIGDDISSSLWVRRRSGTGLVYLHSGVAYIDITTKITSSWQRIQVRDVDTNTWSYFILRADTSGDELDVWRPLRANVTGMPADYVPEYVANLGSGTSVKYFDTTSGNTVLNNIVTEGTGAPLHPSKVIHGEKQYVTKPALKVSTAYAIGDEIEVNGQWLECVQAGTSDATLPLAGVMPALDSPELVGDGGFDNGISEWNITHSTWKNSNSLSITSTGWPDTNNLAIGTLPVGESYVAEFDVLEVTGSGYVKVATGSANSFSTTGHKIFTGVSSGNYLQFTASPSSVLTVDNVSFKSCLLSGTAAFISKGIYNRGYCALSEGVATNKCTNFNADPATIAMTDAATFNAAAPNMVATSGAGTVLFGVITDTTELAAAGLGGICSAVYKIDNSAGTGLSYLQNTAAVGNTNLHSMSCWVRGAGTLRTNSGSSELVFNTVGYVRQKIEGFTPSATSNVLQLRLAAGEVCYFILNQLEESPYATSEIVTSGAPATRTEGLGSLKWLLAGSNIITTGPFTLALGWVPSFASGDRAMTNDPIVTLSNDLDILYLPANTTEVRTYDGATIKPILLASSYSCNDCLNLILTANNTASAINDTPANTMQLSVANKSLGESYVVASKAYDGSFNATTFLQFLKALGGNNSGFRFLKQYYTCLSNAERDLIE